MAALAFGVSLRETLREVPLRPRIGNFYKSRWKVKRGRVARRPPGWWEWRWLAGDDAERDRLSRLLLRWTFRYRAGWLVVGQKDEGLDRVQSALAAAPAAAFLDPLRLSIERALAACESPVQLGPAQPQPFYFNPRLMHPHMTHVTSSLHGGWPELAHDIAKGAQAAQPGCLVEFLQVMAQPRVHRGTFRRLLRELPLPDGLRAKHACELLNFHGVPHWTSSKLATTCQRSDCSATYCWLDHYATEMNQGMATSYEYQPQTR